MDNSNKQDKLAPDLFVVMMGVAALSGWFVVESILYLFNAVFGG